MGDNFTTLWNRVLSRAPGVGPILAQQLINDSWHELQAREDWTFRRRSFTIAPNLVVNNGSVSTNVSTGNPFLISGNQTTFAQAMVGRQIRVSGLNYPYYTIQGVLSPTELLMDQPWAGADVSAQSYQILNVYIPMPQDFHHIYSMVDIQNAVRIWPFATENELTVWDPQRSSIGQVSAAVFLDYYQPSQTGNIGPVIPVTSPTDPTPVATAPNGFTYPANATYIIQVVAGGASGVATFQWMRAGQQSFQPVQVTTDYAVALSDGIMLYWPDGVSYVPGDLFVLNASAAPATGAVPRYELWPPPSYNGYLYPTIYIAKESDLSAQSPNLPPFVANRGEVLLEMALQKAATFPGSVGQPNPYYDLKLSGWHQSRVNEMLIDFTANDKNTGIYDFDYDGMSYAFGPWFDARWQQAHAPTYTGAVY
jgi:hypothetical protein